jgi:methyl-accepting chemotaxis protein
VSEDNAWGRMRKSIMHRFEDQDHLTQQRAWFLYVFCFCAIFMFIIFFFLLFAIYDTEKFKATIVPIIIVEAIAIAAIFFIRAGKYKPAAYSMMIVQSLIVSAGFLIKYKSPIIYEGFVSYVHFMYITIIFATLFCERKAIMLTAVWYIGIFFTYFFAVKDKVSTEALSLVKSGFADGIVGIILCSVLSLLLITAMRRANTQLVDSVAEVRESSLKLTEISGIINTSSQNLASGASDQAASMEETSAMLKEIAKNTRTNTETVTDARKLMHDTTRIVTTTNSSLKSLRSTMDEVNEASVKIANIVQTIDSIAFQTNLLALNAAVEAARAGEAGAGFAVVADEVRSLARKSAEASKNTQDIISSSIQNIKKGAELAITSDEAFVTFMKVTDQLAHHLKVIGESSEDQSRGIAQIEKAVDNMNTVIQSNAANAEETTAVTSELSAMSDDIEAFVHKLDKLVKY